MNLRKLAARSLAGALGLLLTLSLVLAPAPVLAVPQMEHIFYGDVTSDGNPLPPEVIAEEVSVVAKINDTPYAWATVDADSRYGWEPGFKVPADDSDTLEEKEGGVNGDTIDFYVEGVWADSFTFEIGGRDELPLEVDITPPSPPDANLMTVNMNAPGTVDSVEGSVGAVEASATVEVWDNAALREAGNLIDLATANEDGGFAAIDIGDNEYAAVWITAKDAEDNRSDATEMANDIVAPAFVSVAVSDPDEFYKVGDTISFDVDLGETGVTAIADLTVLDSALPSDFALTDDEDGTYSGTTSALSSETMVEGVDTAVPLTATDAAGNPTTDDSLTLTIDKTAPTATLSPVADAPDVAVNAVVSATFDEDVTLVDGTGVSIMGSITGDLLTVVSLEGMTLTIGHEDFASGEDITVTIVSGVVADLAGNPNDEISWGFNSVTITTFIITASAGANGTIDPVGEVEVIEGADQLFTIAPAEGYEIDDVLVDEVSVLDDLVENTYTFLDVAAIHTIAPSFVEIPPTTFIITASAGANGTIDPVGEVEVIEGADQLFTIAPAEGYEIDDVLVDEVSALDDLVENTYTFLDVAAIHTIDATFSIVTPRAVTIDSVSVTSPTNTASLTVTGTRSAGLTVVLDSAEATCGAVTYISDTTWSCDVTLVEGSNVITATADTSTATATIDLDTAAPTVIGVANEDGDTGVPVDTMEIAIFSEPMDELTITIDSFTLDGVSGTVSYDANTNTATFAPSADLDYNTTYTATLSTAITDAVGNPLAEYSWSFTTAKASLGDLIDDILAAGEDTLLLQAGTYSGDITIEESITITGIEGETIIHGGITIGVLTGSEVIIENLTITEYIDYGIRIIKVRDVDDFTIRNNTILGVEGSIGILVDEVEADGTLDIWQNSISGNEIGIKLLVDVAAGAIEFNNIVDNEVGLELQRVEHMVYAGLNWWGDISGPEEGSENPGGTGNKIELADGLGYYPWLTREFQTVLDDNICYFGYPMVWLYPGWNIISTPIALDPLVEWVDSEGTSRTGVNTWGDFKALGNGLDVHATSPAYSFDGENQVWVPLTDDSLLKPCDAIYVRMASFDIAAILYSPTYSVPSKDLYPGWNLISLGWLDPEVYSMPVDEALVTVEQVTGDLTGYKLVVSPNVNAWESPWIYIAGDPSPTPPDGWMSITSGYWVFMLNEGTLAGFTFTPISLWQ